MHILTLTTDFGQKDGFVGVLKGVIWNICPLAQIADISHEIAPQNVLEGALILWRAYPFFPDGTVHLAVVDPGVGTSRRPIAVKIGKNIFVGPDNGLFTPIYDDALKAGRKIEIVELTNPHYQLTHVSHTFHGRDIFAPAAAHLVNGTPLSEFGKPVLDPLRIILPRPEKTITGWVAHVVYIDHFGNLATDLSASQLSGNEILRICGREIHGMVPSYGSKKPGELVALADSEGRLEVAVVNGSAAALLSVRIGDLVEVII